MDHQQKREAVMEQLRAALQNPDLPVGYSIQTPGYPISGNQPIDFPKYSPVHADEYGRLWREDHCKRIVLISGPLLDHSISHD